MAPRWHRQQHRAARAGDRPDVHQGNGTAAIFRDDPTVFTLSLHGAKNFPFRKGGQRPRRRTARRLRRRRPTWQRAGRGTGRAWRHGRAARPGLLPGRRRPARERPPGPPEAQRRGLAERDRRVFEAWRAPRSRWRCRWPAATGATSRHGGHPPPHAGLALEPLATWRATAADGTIPAMSHRPQPPRPAHAPPLPPITTRWMDNDAYGHVNNVVYYSFFDTAVNRYLIDAGALDIHAGAGDRPGGRDPLQLSRRWPSADGGGRPARGRVGCSSVRYESACSPRGRRRALSAGRPLRPCTSTATRGGRCALPPALRDAVEAPTDPTHEPHARNHRRRRRGHHQPPLDPRLPATPVPRETIERILGVARARPRAPTRSPGRCVLMARPPAPERAAILARTTTRAAAQHTEEYAYYPTQWVRPHRPPAQGRLGPVHACSASARPTRPRMHASTAATTLFFDAPVGLIFTIDRMMQRAAGSTTACSCENVMVAARARGLDTCPQFAFTSSTGMIAELDIPPRPDAGLRHVAGPGPTRRRSRTRWSPNASRWPGLPGSDAGSGSARFSAAAFPESAPRSPLMHRCRCPAAWLAHHRHSRSRRLAALAARAIGPVPVEFILFAGVLAGVALFHHRCPSPWAARW